MAENSKHRQAARFLHEAHRARRPYQALPQQVAPSDIQEAYQVQRAFHQLIIPERGPISGYKIALTTPVMQELVGFHHPCAGAVLARDIYQSPATISGSDYVHLGVECEMAVLLEHDLPAAWAPYDRAGAAGSVGALMAAFELIEDWGADYSGLEFLGVVADNLWNGGVVLGPPVSSWRILDLTEVRGTLTINGEYIAEGHGRDVLGHPLDALAWLANTLAEQGAGMSAGMIVMTGSMITTRFLKPGDTATVAIEGLGDASLTVK